MSENQLIEKEMRFDQSEDIQHSQIQKPKNNDSFNDFKDEEEDFETQNSKRNFLQMNMDENQDEQDIIENQSISLMQRDVSKKKKRNRTPKKKSGYDFIKRKKKQENRRLAESKGGYQIAVHDFYYKGQKGNF